MKDIHKSYYAIIPANIRYDTSVTPNAKLLYGEITALCNERGYCWANNEYFANLYGVSKKTISTWISQLREKGYIVSEIVYKEGSKEIKDRYLRICAYPIEENVNTPMEEKVKDNNTIINNTINNTSNKKEKKKTEFDVLIESYTENLNLRSTIYEFIKMRKAIKAPMTSNALKLMLNKLNKLSDNDSTKIAIIEQSIMNSWKGIFELKVDNYSNKTRNFNQSAIPNKTSGFNNFEGRDYDSGYGGLTYKKLEEQLVYGMNEEEDVK